MIRRPLIGQLVCMVVHLLGIEAWVAMDVDRVVSLCSKKLIEASQEDLLHITCTIVRLSRHVFSHDMMRLFTIQFLGVVGTPSSLRPTLSRFTTGADGTIFTRFLIPAGSSVRSNGCSSLR